MWYTFPQWSKSHSWDAHWLMTFLLLWQLLLLIFSDGVFHMYSYRNQYGQRISGRLSRDACSHWCIKPVAFFMLMCEKKGVIKYTASCLLDSSWVLIQWPKITKRGRKNHAILAGVARIFILYFLHFKAMLSRLALEKRHTPLGNLRLAAVWFFAPFALEAGRQRLNTQTL